MTLLIIHFSFVKIPGQVPGQVFTKKRLKEVNYEKYKSISIRCPIEYQ